MRRMRWTIALLVMMLGAPKAEAACTVTATAVAFGSYDVYAAGPTDSTGTIIYRCSASDHDIRIAISAGTSGTFANRTLKTGSENLLYNLFYGGFTQVWGDGTSSTITVPGSIMFTGSQTSRSTNHSIYGRAPAQQSVRSGSYNDTIVVTITF